LKLDLNPDITIEEFKELINLELHLNAKTIKIELENEDAFGKILEAGSLKTNGCRNGDRITVTSVDIEYGTNVYASPALSQIYKDQFDPTHSAHAWRDHDRGVNYEASCPTVPDRRVIVNRGFGTFDWATDPLELSCSCCHQRIDPRTVTRVAVNHCEWTWGGITDTGEKLKENGLTQDLNEWIIDGNKQWRKLFIQAVDPFKQEVKPPTTYFTCALCKSEYPQNQIEMFANRQFCRSCAKQVQSRLEERDKHKEQQHEHHYDDQEEFPVEKTPQEAKVLLPGLGQSIELRRIFRPSRGGGENN